MLTILLAYDPTITVATKELVIVKITTYNHSKSSIPSWESPAIP